MKKITINANDAGQRVDKFLQKYFRSALPSSLIYKYIRKKRIKLNGGRCYPEQFLAEADIMELYINDEFFTAERKSAALSAKADFDVVYEDKNIILINKKAGVTVHKADSEKGVTLAEQVLGYLIQKGEYSPDKENTFTPALCNRLDRNTTGMVVAAKNAAALRDMNSIIKNRRVKKTYLALCEGVFEQKSEVITGYLSKDGASNKVCVAARAQDGAREIITAYTVLEQHEDTALVEVELVTGRTHQIRAHLAYIGHPIAGDKKYGAKNSSYSHHQLHSFGMEFADDLADTVFGYLEGKKFTCDKL